MYDLDPNTPIPEADPEDKAPTAGLLSSQVNNNLRIEFTRVVTGSQNVDSLKKPPQ